MYFTTSECVDCGMHCEANCPYLNVEHYVCDSCDTDSNELYCYNGMELCEDCLLEQFEKIDIDECIVYDSENIEYNGRILTCEECGNDSDSEYYICDGRIFCADCLLEQFQKVEREEV